MISDCIVIVAGMNDGDENDSSTLFACDRIYNIYMIHRGIWPTVHLRVVIHCSAFVFGVSQTSVILGARVKCLHVCVCVSECLRM